MFITLSGKCIQNLSKWHALFVFVFVCLFVLFLFVCFVFLSNSVAVAAWSGIQRVDQQMIYFEPFLSSGAQEPVQPPNNICLV